MAEIDSEKFGRRLRKIYTAFKSDDTLRELGCFAVAVGNTEEVAYSKSTALHTWLFSYELPDSAVVFFCDSMTFLASKKKINFLKLAADSFEDLKIRLLQRDKADNDESNLSSVLKEIRSKGKSKIGLVRKDRFDSDFVSQFNKSVLGNFEAVDISRSLAELMAVKEPSELESIRVACEATSKLYRSHIRKTLVEIIDGEKSVKHSKLANSAEDSLKKDAAAYAPNVADAADSLDTCYPAIIQSGGNYQLKFSAQSDNSVIEFDSIISMVGLRYRSYCSNVGRTLLFEPSKTAQNHYEVLLKLEEHLLTQLVGGATLSTVFDSCLSYLKEQDESLVDKLVRPLGFLTGIEFRDSQFIIGPKCAQTVAADMVFIVSCGFVDLKWKSGKKYAVSVSDTVLVRSGEPALCLTTVKKAAKNSMIFLCAEEDNKENDVRAQVEESMGRSKRAVVQEAKARAEQSNEQKRMQHQQYLFENLQESSRERVQGIQSNINSKLHTKSVVSYRNPSHVPDERDIREMQVFVDRKNDSIIFPIFGSLAAFHIATIKNVSNTVEGDYIYVRINFFHPGAAIAKEGQIFDTDKAYFVKELTFRSSSRVGINHEMSGLMNSFRLIKEMQKRFRAVQAEEREREGIVEQDQLVLNSGKSSVKLKDLYIRPNLHGQKRLSGNLEAHLNGFRFSSIRGDKVDIMYNNIKHAFYQSCDGEMIILLHFHLKNAVLLGKKKHVDLQFYHEVGEMTTDLGKGHLLNDRDDLHAEQAEREYRNRLKAAFRNFTEKVRDLTKNNLDFDTPFRPLGFMGSPFRSTVMLMPTSGCLVNLTEWPPFVVSLDEVELVHFERVQFQLKNFDMVFVFKDYSRKVAMVSSIQMAQLEHIKDWLDSCDIVYTEGVQNLNWPKIMKAITDDPEGFFDTGGWTFLRAEEDDEDEEQDDEDSEPDYRPDHDSEEVSGGSFDESDEDDGESDWSAEESADEASLGSDESEGKDWDELEREAKSADAKAGEFDERDRHHHNDRKRKYSGHRSSGHRSSGQSGPKSKKKR